MPGQQETGFSAKGKVQKCVIEVKLRLSHGNGTIGKSKVMDGSGMCLKSVL